MRRGEVWWADLPEPLGSEPGHRRPVVIVQHDRLNASELRTVMIVPCTTNLRRGLDGDNLVLAKRATGLPHDSVALLAQVTTINRFSLEDRIGSLKASWIEDLNSRLLRTLGLG